MAKLNFDEIAKMSSRITVNGYMLSGLLEVVNPILNKEKIMDKKHIFYPQGLFVGKKLNLLFFTKDGINGLTVDEDIITFSYIKMDRIRKVSLDVLTKDESYNLLIKFDDDSSLILNPQKDTNDFHLSTFKDRIIDVYKLLTTGEIDIERA